MKKLKYDTVPYRGISTLDAVKTVWRKNFVDEASKFISSTHLQPEDLETEFVDENGETWKILGQMEGKDMPCEKLSTNEIFVWDRWKVSMLVRPVEHAKAIKKIEMVKPVKERAKRAKKITIEKPNDEKQLDLF